MLLGPPICVVELFILVEGCYAWGPPPLTVVVVFYPADICCMNLRLGFWLWV